MGAVMIGVDPHKASHTAVAISAAEESLGELRVRACAAQAERLVAWAAAWPQRTWAVEGAGGTGHLLAQQLLAAGERVLDVQPRLGARVRLQQRYLRLPASRRAAAADHARDPGGQQGNDSISSAASSHPWHRLFGQATPGPGPHTTTAPPRRPGRSWPFLDSCQPAVGDAAGPGGAPAAKRGRTTWRCGETTATLSREEGQEPSLLTQRGIRSARLSRSAAWQSPPQQNGRSAWTSVSMLFISSLMQSWPIGASVCFGRGNGGVRWRWRHRELPVTG
jgi:hypothetical protein